jgi:hypothetical protein
VIPFVKPDAPATIEVEAGPGQLIVRWGTPPAKAGTEVVGYSVESQKTGVTDWQALEPLDAEAREAVIDGLEPDAAYRVRVAAITEFGVGEWAEPTSLAVPLTTVPALRVETTLSNPRPALGDTVTVRIRVTSAGGVAAENIELKLTPDAPRLRVLTWQAEAGVVDAATLIWRMGSLEPGAEVIVELEAVVIEGTDAAPAGASEGAPAGATPEAAAAGGAR